MDHHFVPQAHQRRFECPERPGFVWMYDKDRRSFSQVSIKAAAQSRKFYDQHVEEWLAQEVEMGKLPLEIPRDRNGTFEPQLIGKHQRRLAGFDER